MERTRRVHGWRVFAAAVAVGLLAAGGGCESAGGETAGGGDGASDTDGSVAADVATGPGDEERPLPEDADLTGTWALLNVHTADTTLPVIGAAKTQTVSHFLVEVAQDGRDVTLTTTVCSLAIDNDIDDDRDKVVTIVPDAFVASLAVTERPARLEPVEGGLRFVQPRWYDVRGATLADPAADPLPTEPDDPRVYDQDEDGNPGVTLRVTGIVDGEVYVVQRGSDAFTGRYHTVDEIAGLTDWTDEQVVLDADNELLEATRDSSPAAPEESWFRMRRIDPGSTCADVLADAEALFGR